MNLFKNKIFKLVFFVMIGGAIGFAYYYFIGCRTGSCPITSTWYISTIYGMFTGGILGFPQKEKSKLSDGTNTSN
jgi:hypothetical protein